MRTVVYAVLKIEENSFLTFWVLEETTPTELKENLWMNFTKQKKGLNTVLISDRRCCLQVSPLRIIFFGIGPGAILYF
jgi:hypothetical protein